MSSEHIQNVKEELKNIFDKTGDDVFCVSFGHKQKNSIYTDEKSIRFGVARKKPLSEIPPEEVIPSTLVVDGVEYKTDVFEVKKMFSVGIEKVSNQSDVVSYNNFLSSQTAGANIAVGFDYTHCSTYKLVTNTPGATVNVLVEDICGQRTSSYLNILDGATFCFDNIVTSRGGPVTGTGYSWILDDPFNNNQSYRCIEFYTCNYNSSVTPPISEHRVKIRPLVGGISMINRQVNGQGYAGTLGGVVIDQTDNKMVGLTNAHVSGTPSYLNGGSKMGYFYANEVSGGYYAHYDGIENTQPSNGESPGSNYSYFSNDKIGTTKRIFPLTLNGYNYIDCAILNLSSSVVDTNSWKQKNLNFETPPVFATTEEIDSITISTPLMTSGRTSGPKGTYVTQSSYYSNVEALYVHKTSVTCNFIATSISTASGVGGYTLNGNIVYFADLILLQSEYPHCMIPTIGGDSGSLLYAYINGAWKIVGLIFAGDGLTMGLACRIDRVASLMKLQAYTGDTVNANPNNRTQVLLDYNTYGGQASASIGGKTYWQLGRNFL